MANSVKEDKSLLWCQMLPVRSTEHAESITVTTVQFPLLICRTMTLMKNHSNLISSSLQSVSFPSSGLTTLWYWQRAFRFSPKPLLLIAQIEALSVGKSGFYINTCLYLPADVRCCYFATEANRFSMFVSECHTCQFVEGYETAFR